MSSLANRILAFTLLLAVAGTAPAEPITPPSAAPDAVPANPHGAELVGPEQKPDVSIALNSPTGAYEAGDLLRAKVRVEKAAYVYVFYHQANKQAVLLFPNNARRSNRIGSRTTVETPGKNDPLQCRIGAPFGREVVQVIASPTRIYDFEKALDAAGQGVPVMPTATVDQICQKHGPRYGLVADYVTVTTQQKSEK